MPPCIDLIHTQLLHCLPERLKELVLIRCVRLHERLRPRITVQPVIGPQQPQPLWQVLEVHVVEFVGSHDVIEHRQRGVFLIIGTSLLQSLSEPRIVLRVVLRITAEVIDPGAKLLAMRKPNCVSTAQSHGFLDREPIGREKLDNLRERHRGSGKLAFHIRRFRDQPIFASKEDIVVGTADHGDEVARGDGEDVGAGDGVGAGELEGGLGSDDDVEGVAGE